MNVGYMTLDNLEVKDFDTSKDTEINTGLLSRGKPTKQKNIMDMEPRVRIGSYVSQIRKARMELKK